MTYIDPRAKVLRYPDRIAAWRAGQKPAPVTVEIDLSNRCPLGCAACHFAYTHTRGPWAVTDRALPLAHEGVGDLADLSVLVPALEQMAAAGVRSVVWSGGGEPTTHPEWMRAVEAADRLGLEQGMYTMAGLLTGETAAFLAARATWVVVSLDAADAATYAAYKRVAAVRFRAACDGLRWLTGHHAVIGASFLLDRTNWRDARAMLALARRLGATYTTFRPLIETSPADPGQPLVDRGWVWDALPWLSELAIEADVECDPDRFLAYATWAGHGYARCSGPTMTSVVTPDGRVWICPNRRGFAGSCLGDLRTESFAGIWARHPGHWTVDRDCRAMCRLHSVNTVMAELESPKLHEAFI